jgi:hypothetical protein
VLDAWVDAKSAPNNQRLDLLRNNRIGDVLPSGLFDTTDAQAILAAYRRFRDELDDNEPPRETAADVGQAISADRPQTPVFTDTDGCLDLNSLANADRVSTAPLNQDPHADARRLAIVPPPATPNTVRPPAAPRRRWWFGA